TGRGAGTGIEHLGHLPRRRARRSPRRADPRRAGRRITADRRGRPRTERAGLAVTGDQCLQEHGVTGMTSTKDGNRMSSCILFGPADATADFGGYEPMLRRSAVARSIYREVAELADIAVDRLIDGAVPHVHPVLLRWI